MDSNCTMGIAHQRFVLSRASGRAAHGGRCPPYSKKPGLCPERTSSAQRETGSGQRLPALQSRHRVALASCQCRPGLHLALCWHWQDASATHASATWGSHFAASLFRWWSTSHSEMGQGGRMKPASWLRDRGPRVASRRLAWSGQAGRQLVATPKRSGPGVCHPTVVRHHSEQGHAAACRVCRPRLRRGRPRAESRPTRRPSSGSNHDAANHRRLLTSSALQFSV
jgi:hypothetical protein